MTERRALPVWRSMLFVPVNVERFVAGAAARGSDAVILDLEDSVPPAEKARARTMVEAAAPRVAARGADVVVRINRPLELAVRDIEAVVSPAIAALIVPKVDSASHVRLLAELLDTVEAGKGITPGHTRLMVLVETPSAFARVEEIAAAHPRLVAMGLGSEDFALEIGGEAATDVLAYPKQRTAIAAIAAGILPMGIVGSVAEIEDMDAYRAAVRLARRFGFKGASCIHPKHVAILNEAFSPTRAEVDWAERTITAYRAAVAEGRASLVVDGKMVDIPIVVKAERILAEQARIDARLAAARART
jgi:citrate lyase subunit beta/citryl-CoA lyase